MARLTIDPITRIEGHLRVDLEVDNGHIDKALGLIDDVARHREGKKIAHVKVL